MENGPDKIERNTYSIAGSNLGSALGVLLNRLNEFQNGNPYEIWISETDSNSLFMAYHLINDVMPHQKALEDDIAALKKKIKHAKTPMERNTLSKQLNVAYKKRKNNHLKKSTKEGKNMDMFNGMFGKVQNGMCRLSMNGGIAVKTKNGYKTYNLKTNKLTNCNNFVFNIGEEFFFVIPTNKVEAGDIIIVGGKPKCVISNDKDTIKVLNYEDSTVENILPERHVFMGNTYFYGKIVSMFGNDIMKGKKGMNKMMSYMMMSEIMKGANMGGQCGNAQSGGMGTMLPFMMMGGGMADMFNGIFDFDVDDGDDTEDNDSEEKREE